MPTSNNEKVLPESEVQRSIDDKAEGLEASKDNEKPQPSTHEELEYCILPEWQKIALMLTASFATIISPISTSIYLPAVNVLTRDLGVSISLINVTISTYLVSIVPYPSKPSLISSPDLPGHRTLLHRSLIRKLRSPPSIHDVLRYIPRREHRPRSPKRLCSPCGAKMHAELGQQRDDRTWKCSGE